MKKSLFLLAAGLSALAQAQDYGNFSGGFESNTQWLQDDEGAEITAPNEKLRSNNYFLLNYNLGKFTAGVQYESYLPVPLLGYAPELEGNGIANYYLNFKTDQLDITGGFFYEQFGSGLTLRAWEDRQLGINTALKGARVKFSPTWYFDITGVYGHQRNGFEISEGTVQGLDANFAVGTLLNWDDWVLDFGGSYVGRYQDNLGSIEVPLTIGMYSGRMDLVYKGFYGAWEGVYKEEDALVNEQQLTNDENLYQGSALLVNLGYATSGFGVNTSLRRLENFGFYADRFAEGNQYNQQLINYIPALTKQYDYLLTNIYVYNSQPRLIIQDIQQQAGEVGMQLDAFYTIKKGTAMGGKYGTKFDFNFSYWAGLDAEFDVENHGYASEFIGDGQRYFRELNVEMRKRWTSKLTGIYSYNNLIIDKGITDGSPLGISDIYADVVVADHLYNLGKGRSVKLELQHLWTQQDHMNWAGGLIEYNFSPHLSLFVADSWNYGDTNIHYYTFGGSYTKGRARVGANYGRQRGGLICVGGVCRFVPENTGLNLNLTVNF